MGNLFHSHRPNFAANLLNWLATLSPGSQISKLARNNHCSVIDRIITSNSCVLSSCFIKQTKIEKFWFLVGTSNWVYYSTNWYCSTTSTPGMFTMSHAKNGNNKYLFKLLKSSSSLQNLGKNWFKINLNGNLPSRTVLYPNNSGWYRKNVSSIAHVHWAYLLLVFWRSCWKQPRRLWYHQQWWWTANSIQRWY